MSSPIEDPAAPPPAELVKPAAAWDPAFEGLAAADWSAIRERVGSRLDDSEAAALGRCAVAAERELLRGLCIKTLVLELNCARLLGQLAGPTPEARFAGFVARFADPAGWRALLDEYAGLAAAVTVVRGQFREHVVELCARLAADRDELVARGWLPGPRPRLIDAEASLSDPHCGGRGVWRLVLGGGEPVRTVMYKPKPLAIDVRFAALLERCNAAIARGELAGVPPFHVMGVLDRGDYGWVEFVEAGACADDLAVARFYRGQGALLALLHVLLATDVHHENLIAHGERPVVVDLETLFHPFVVAPAPAPASRAAAEAALERSVLRVGLLPWRALSGEGAGGINVGALGAGDAQMLPFPVPRWDQAGRDDMRLVARQGELLPADNLPRIGDRRVPYFEHAGAIVDGFAAMARWLSRERAAWVRPGGVLDGFAGSPVRYVVRPTRSYARVLHATAHPDHLRTRDVAPGVRAALDGSGDALARDPQIRAAEDADLAARDVPYFSGRPDSTGVWDSRGRRLDFALPAPTLELARAQLAAFDDAEVERQLWYTRAALAAGAFGQRAPRLDPVAPGRAGVDPEGAASELARALAIELAERLAERAITGPDGASWIGLVDCGADSFAVGPLGPELYDGVAGIALAFAAAARATGDDRFAELAERTARRVRGDLSEPARPAAGSGGFVGVGSQLYALAHVGDAALAPAIEPALARLAALDAGHAVRDADIIYGAAGTLLGLIAAYRVSRREALLPHMLSALAAIERAAVAQPAGVAWPNPRFERPLLGFSHGSAGITCALARLGELLGREGHPAAARCAELAAGGRRHERAWFDPARRNWPDFRSGLPAGNHLIAWCHGAPGVALARLSGPLDGDALVELDTAIATTLDAEPRPGHTLCHGELGNLAIVAHAAARLGRADWRAQVAARVPALVGAIGERLALDTAFADASLGLMTGIAGVSYGLLALADPDRPFALALEPPR